RDEDSIFVITVGNAAVGGVIVVSELLLVFQTLALGLGGVAHVATAYKGSPWLMQLVDVYINELPNRSIVSKKTKNIVPQPSGPTKYVADEAVHKELGDSLVRAATAASSLEAEQDSGNINKIQSKATPNESSSQGTNSDGGPRVLEKRNRLRTHKLKRLYKVGLTARVESSDDEVSSEMFDVDDLSGEEVFVAEQEVVSTAATTVTTKELILAQALKALKTLKPKVKRIVIQEQKEP
nr:hypothetical protein [Tanacetum cinerariifolium]